MWPAGEHVPGWSRIDGLGLICEARQTGEVVDLLLSLSGTLSYPLQAISYIGVDVGRDQVGQPRSSGSPRRIPFRLMV